MKPRNRFESLALSEVAPRHNAIVVRVYGDLPKTGDGSPDDDDAFSCVVSALNHFAIPATVNEIASADPLSLLDGAQKAARFFQELMDSFETVGGVADQFGQPVLPQLLYLQNAILTHSHVDLWEDVDDGLRKAVARLPSAAEWFSYCVEQGAPSPQPGGNDDELSAPGP